MTKIYIEKQKVTYDTAAHVTDEYIKRVLLHKLIDNMSIEDLSKVFKIEVLNPISNESQQRLFDPNTPEWKKEQIRINRETLTLEYEASIRVSNYQK